MPRPNARSRRALHDVADKPKVEARIDNASASGPELIGNVLQKRTSFERRRKGSRDLGSKYKIENIPRASHASACTKAERVLNSLTNSIASFALKQFSPAQ
jgi:hypothetical protein